MRLQHEFGREDMARLAPLTWMNADVLLMCFAIDDPKSFESLTLDYLAKASAFVPRKDVRILLVGLKREYRATELPECLVSTETALDLARKFECVGYFEVSSFEYIRATNPTQRQNLSPSVGRGVAAGGVEELFTAILHSSAPPPPPSPTSRLARFFSKFNQKPPTQPQLLVNGSLTNEFGNTEDEKRFMSVLMCRHERLGKDCPSSLREIPDELWLKIFASARRWSHGANFYC
eukprot:c13192_g1_i4.p1 GENE.c13192_g1_i4~~c13192_g1_i4.p1  ORF type:complete len:234 (+),score=54.39 c13192_g1_i4:258-959(+)